MEELKWGGEPRKQKDAKAYAEAVKEVGRELGVPVVDAWSAFMEKAGWKMGDEVLVGTKESGKSEVLEELLYDGQFSSNLDRNSGLINNL
jgi:isoamyl acetate esterase